MKTLKTQLVAEICLYGNRETGAGWLARMEDGALLGNGEPKAGRSNTEAVWRACDQIGRVLGMCGGRPRNATVRVFASGGDLMADTSLTNPATFGDLKWVPATVYVVSAEAIEQTATK